MRFSKNVSRGVTYVLVVVVAVAAAQLVVESALGASPIYVVVSGSMTPTLKVGDLVITEGVSFSQIHVGDVIIYDKPTPQGTCPNPAPETIVHRVVQITSRGLITQGDNRVTNPHPDEPGQWPPVPPSCLRGLVVLAIPYVGLVSMMIPTPWNYVLVGLILLVVFLSEIRPSGGDEGGEEGLGSSETGSAPEPPSQSPGSSLRSAGSLRTTC